MACCVLRSAYGTRPTCGAQRHHFANILSELDRLRYALTLPGPLLLNSAPNFVQEESRGAAPERDAWRGWSRRRRSGSLWWSCRGEYYLPKPRDIGPSQHERLFFLFNPLSVLQPFKSTARLDSSSHVPLKNPSGCGVDGTAVFQHAERCDFLGDPPPLLPPRTSPLI